MDKSKSEIKNKIAKELTKSESDMCMCVILNISARTERIIVGSQRDIQKNARNINNSNLIIFDEIRELGQLFLDVKKIDVDKWQSVLNEMKSNLSYFRALSDETMNFLKDQNIDNNPINVYLALSTRKEYYLNKNNFNSIIRKEHFYLSTSEKTSFISDFSSLFDFLSFSVNNNNSDSQLPDISMIHKDKEYIDDYVMIWYPDKNRKTEYIFSAGNISGFLDFYAGILQSKKLKYQICDCCGKCFMTTSKKNKLCSESCKIAEKNIAQARYKEKHANRPEENAYNRLRKAINRNIANCKCSEDEKKILERCSKEILNIAQKGKRKVFKSIDDIESFIASTTVYRETFKKYLKVFENYSTIEKQSDYSEANKRRIENHLYRLWPTILQYANNLEENKTTIEEYKKDVHAAFESMDSLKKQLNKNYDY